MSELDDFILRVKKDLEEDTKISSPCSCLCDNCKRAADCHYGSYHCRHWVRRYGDLEGYGVCLMKMVMDREVADLPGRAEAQGQFHDQYMLMYNKWYKSTSS